jgi:hypothetical protein
MAQRFIAGDREQSLLMPPDVREWLPGITSHGSSWEAVESIDFDAFYAVYRAADATLQEVFLASQVGGAPATEAGPAAAGP